MTTYYEGLSKRLDNSLRLLEYHTEQLEYYRDLFRGLLQMRVEIIEELQRKAEEQEKLLQVITDYCSGITPKTRGEILRLRLIEGLTLSEISDLCDYSKENCSRICRAELAVLPEEITAAIERLAAGGDPEEASAPSAGAHSSGSAPSAGAHSSGSAPSASAPSAGLPP